MWNARYAGTAAGWHTEKDGYLVVRLNGVLYKAHRVIFKIVTGEDPSADLDHKDRNPSDNRWDQLRPATRQQNNWNTRLRSDNTTGFCGIRRQRNGKYQARIWSNGACRYFGGFPTPEEAAAARKTIARELQGEFYREK